MVLQALKQYILHGTAGFKTTHTFMFLHALQQPTLHGKQQYLYLNYIKLKCLLALTQYL